MRIKDGFGLDFDDVLIVPQRSTLSSRKEVDLVRTFKMPHSDRSLSCIPIIAANMDTVGTLEAAKVLGQNDCLTAIHKHYTNDELAKEFNSSDHGMTLRKRTFLTFGICSINEIEEVLSATNLHGLPILNLDVANGYQEKFVEFVKDVRKSFPRAIIMAGNVVTPAMTEALILAGADIVKVGIGPGQQCETRKVTGVGYPQLSAIIECADAAHGLKGLVCADGGCKNSGDVAKALAAGADFVMVGSMLAGHKETISEDEREKISSWRSEDSLGKSNLDYPSNEIYVQTYGMSSTEAMTKHSGGVANYRSSEGKCSKILYRGPIQNTIEQILGGIRSTCTYVGAKTLKELSKRTTFVVKK